MDESIIFKRLCTYKSCSTFSVKYYGKRVHVIVTATPSVVRRWISTVRYVHRNHIGNLVVGLGVQWSPHRRHRRQPVATLQLCVVRRCLIFQIYQSPSIPKALRDFLSYPYINFVGIRTTNDAKMLNDNYDLSIQNLVEIGHLAARVTGRGFLYGASMELLASNVLGGKKTGKKAWVGRTDWEDEDLSDEQVKYASLDAIVSSQLGMQLKAWKR